MTQAKFPMMLDAERAKYVTREIKYEQEIESLRQQLSAALAAIKVKDEAILHMCHNVIADDNYDGNLVQKALAIQPDDSALQTFAEKVREQCAQVCNNLTLDYPGRADLTADQCAEDIRNLKELP